jgi:hypothetical protein
MKKFLLIGLLIAFVLIIVGGAGVVYARIRGTDNITAVTVNTAQAQKGEKIIQQFGYGPGGMMDGNRNGYGPGGMMGGDGFGYGPGGMMGGRGFGPGGMMGGRGVERGEGIMHDYMVSAFADAVGLTVDQVNTRFSNGETFKEIAIAQGKTEADLPALISKVRQAALDKAVAGGVITQAQADLMLEHMNNYSGEGFGPGFGFGDCPMLDGDEVQQP